MEQQQHLRAEKQALHAWRPKRQLKLLKVTLVKEKRRLNLLMAQILHNLLKHGQKNSHSVWTRIQEKQLHHLRVRRTFAVKRSRWRMRPAYLLIEEFLLQHGRMITCCGGKKKQLLLSDRTCSHWTLSYKLIPPCWEGQSRRGWDRSKKKGWQAKHGQGEGCLSCRSQYSLCPFLPLVSSHAILPTFPALSLVDWSNR